MKFNLFLLLVLIISILIGQAIKADTYTWTDIWGTTHFVDTPNKVPAKYPLKTFEFTKEHKWSVDFSDPEVSNRNRLNYLKDFNSKPKNEVIAPIIIEGNKCCERRKKHRSSQKK